MPKSRVQKKTTPSPEGNDSAALPPGWCWTTLGEVTQSMKNGIYRPASSYSDDGTACLRMYNIDQGRIVWKDIKRMDLTEEELAEYELLPGDLLVNRVNSRELVGKAAEIPAGLERCVFESKNIRVRLWKEAVVPAFVNYRLLLAGSEYFNRNAQQVAGMASVNQPQVARFPLPLPPIAEQQRIVTKLDATLARIDKGEAAARRALGRLQRYRAAILQAAVTSELTHEWRKTNPPGETGPQLLKRLLYERRARWEASELKRLQANGKLLKSDSWKNGYEEPEPAKLDGLPELPEGWTWASLGQLFSIVRNGISVPPSNESGLPSLRVSAVRPMLVDLSERRYFPESRRKQYSNYALDEGDLLFTRYNGSKDLAGVCGRVPALDETIIYPDKLIRCVPVPGFSPLGQFIEIAANSGLSREIIADSLRTTAGQWGLSGMVLKDVPIPLPPLAEQKVIVAEVERKLLAGERLRTNLSRQLELFANTRRSILCDAFDGNLSEQDPKDEPASSMLERTRAIRGVVIKKTKTKRMPKPKLLFGTWKLFDEIKERFADNSFTFEALRNQIPAAVYEYDDLKNHLYEMLRISPSGAEPVLQMYFDAKREVMVFKLRYL